MKAALTNGTPPARIPILSNAQSPKIDYTSDPLFELANVKTDPPPEPERFTELFIESHQDQDDKDKDIRAVFRVLFDSNAYVDFTVGKGNGWGNPGNVRIKIRTPAIREVRLCLADLSDPIDSFNAQLRRVGKNGCQRTRS